MRRVLREILIPLLSIVTALLISVPVVAIACQGDWSKVAAAYGGLIDGAILKPNAFTNTLVSATPLILTGLAITLAFRAGMFNIGGSGQFLIGACAGAFVAYAIQLPPVIHAIVVIVVGALAGALWGAIPGILKALRGSHEVITTIMLNYVAFLLTDWLIKGPMKDAVATNVRTPEIFPSAELGRIFSAVDPNDRLHWGFVIALGMAVVVWWLLSKTTLGFELRTTGSNPDAARYAGIRPMIMIVLAMAFSGALAGMAGIIQVQGLDHFMPALFSSDFGFDGITVAFLGQLNPWGVIPAAILLGLLRNGSDLMQIRSGGVVSKEVVFIVQALILLFIAAPAIIRWLYRLRIGKTALEGAPLTTGWGK
jgi:simple sugar transport system permease protein